MIFLRKVAIVFVIFHTIFVGMAFGVEMKEALDLRTQKKYKQSIQAFKKLEKKHPLNTDIKSEMAMTYAWNGQLKESLDLYDKILQKDQSLDHVRISKIWVLMWRQDYGKAKKEIAFLQSKSSTVNTDREEAYLYMKTLKFDQSKGLYKKILQDQPESIEAKNSLKQIETLSRLSVGAQSGVNQFEGKNSTQYTADINYKATHKHNLGGSIRKGNTGLLTNQRTVYEGFWSYQSRKQNIKASYGFDKRVNGLGHQIGFQYATNLGKKFYTGLSYTHGYFPTLKDENMVRLDLTKVIGSSYILNQTFLFAGDYQSVVNVTSFGYNFQKMKIKHYGGFGIESFGPKWVAGSNVSFKVSRNIQLALNAEYVYSNGSNIRLTGGVRKNF